MSSREYIRTPSEDNDYFEKPYYMEDRYLYDYQWYHIKFPLQWAMSHSEGTGPSQCGNCVECGYFRGVFIGYCASCANFDYHGTRGRGFVKAGVEVDKDIADKFDIPIYDGEYVSAFDTYLKDVDIEEIPLDDPSDNSSDDSSDDITNSIMDCHFEGGYNDF